jgi:hypothetical protein
LRVQQYGWTVERIATLACILVAACYALGYTAGALFSLLGGQWMWALESVNIFIAFLILAVLLALFTPLADPARLSVLSQVSRLEAGSIAPDKFDYLYLHHLAGRYGDAALIELSKNGRSADIRADASLALKGQTPKTVLPDFSKRIVVSSPSRTLPAWFAKQDWVQQGGSWPPCLIGNAICDVYFLDVDHDGVDEIVMLARDPYATSAIFKEQKSGAWDEIGMFNLPKCSRARAAIRAGHLAPITPLFSVPDLDADGQRIAVISPTGYAQTTCPD